MRGAARAESEMERRAARRREAMGCRRGRRRGSTAEVERGDLGGQRCDARFGGTPDARGVGRAGATPPVGALRDLLLRRNKRGPADGRVERASPRSAASRRSPRSPRHWSTAYSLYRRAAFSRGTAGTLPPGPGRGTRVYCAASMTTRLSASRCLLRLGTRAGPEVPPAYGESSLLAASPWRMRRARARPQWPRRRPRQAKPLSFRSSLAQRRTLLHPETKSVSW